MEKATPCTPLLQFAAANSRTPSGWIWIPRLPLRGEIGPSQLYRFPNLPSSSPQRRQATKDDGLSHLALLLLRGAGDWRRSPAIAARRRPPRANAFRRGWPPPAAPLAECASPSAPTRALRGRRASSG